MGVQWLSGRVLDLRPRGRGFEPHQRHCVVSLSMNINLSLVLVQPKKTRPFITERLLMGPKESNSLACLFSDGHCPVIVPALNVYLTDKLPAFVSVQDSSLDVIALMRILHAFNRYWATVYEVSSFCFLTFLV